MVRGVHDGGRRRHPHGHGHDLAAAKVGSEPAQARRRSACWLRFRPFPREAREALSSGASGSSTAITPLAHRLPRAW
jgi:hypothetical protein